jgi:CBS domain-containing membrane protein
LSLPSPNAASAWWRAFLPARTAIGARERWRAATGALIGLAIAGAAGLATMGPSAALPFLIAPMGASAVLLFCLPASPLAQPWSILAGNLVSGAIGITCARLVPLPLAAAALAMGLSIGAMLALRCLHPPSGAMAVMTTLGGPAVHAAGYGFLIAPVTLNGLVLVVVAIAWNHATGRRYPHSQRHDTKHPQATADAPPIARLGFTSEDLRAVLREHGELIDVSEDDLESLFLRVERQTHRRRFGEMRCEHVMSRDVVTVEFATPLDEAWTLMHRHDVPTMPVIDRARRVIGVLGREDFVRALAMRPEPDWGDRLRALLMRTQAMHSDKAEVVGQVMTVPAVTVSASTALVDLVPRMADAGHHHLPVVGGDEKLVGIIAPSDVIAALYESGLALPG